MATSCISGHRTWTRWTHIYIYIYVNIYCSHELNTANKLESNVDSNSHCVNESLQFAMLNYIDVDVNGLQLPVHALIDGGS